jgi:hypothetical protein
MVPGTLFGHRGKNLYRKGKPRYTGNMEIALEYNEAAFRHEIGKEDIAHAVKTRIYDAPLTGFPDKYVVIGFDTKGNPLEIIELFKNFSF